MSVCDSLIRDAFGAGGDRLTEKEIRELQSELRRRAREIAASDPSIGLNDAVTAAGKEFAENAERAALVKKRNEYLQVKRFTEAYGLITTHYADRPSEGLKALLVGVQSGRVLSRDSAGANIDLLERTYFSGLIHDISRVEGGMAIIDSGTLDKDISNALWRLSSDEALDGIDPRAIGIAKAIAKWQEVARTEANMAGAWTGKLRGYITTQTHDPRTISGDPEGWKAMMRDHADIARMMRETGAESEDALLDGLYEALSTGIHLKSSGKDGRTFGAGLKGMARRLSQERVIHFKSADDWFAYNEKFGGGNLRETVFGHLKNQARATGLMRVLGPSHEATYDNLVSRITAQLKGSAKAKFADDAKTFKTRYLAEVDGSLDVPGNAPLAYYAAAVRAWQNMASLGGSVLASVGDLGVMLTGARHLGENGFSMVGKGIGNMFTGVSQVEKLELYADLGLALESMIGKMINSRFSIDDGVPGAVGQMQKAFFTANLQNRWTDSMRASIAEFMASSMARRVDTKFNDLPEMLQSTMRQYGIDSAEWNLLRRGTMMEMDGVKMLTPSQIRNVPDERIAAYLEAKGQKATRTAIDRAKFEIERRTRNFFVDQNGYMMLTPDSATRGVMKQGTQRGTGMGEAIRFIMQFKSFAIAFSQRVVARQFKQGGVAGVSSMIAWSVLAGYAAMTLKDLSRGKKPRDPFDPKTALAAFQQGGGAGIYSDLLFSQILDRRGQDAAFQLLGPTASDANELIKLAARVKDGNDPTAAGVRFVQNNTPFINLFYTRLAMDYFVLWNMQEALNPGSIYRMEREMEERTGQQYLQIASPTKAIQ